MVIKKFIKELVIKLGIKKYKPYSFNSYIDNIPLLHTWDGGKTYNSGGFESIHLKKINDFINNNLIEGSNVIETGSGNSTILFILNSKIKKLISICPEKSLFERIEDYCYKHNLLYKGKLKKFINGSEWVLPAISKKMIKENNFIDFALIDGNHNSCMVMIDFFYINSILRKGGYLLIDDVNLHSVRELVKMLNSLDDWNVVSQYEKIIIFKKTSEDRFLRDWSYIPYIKDNSLLDPSDKNMFRVL